MDGKIIATKLHRIENAISGTLDNPEIQTRLSVFGYTSERILKGKQMLDKVSHLMTTNVKKYGSQYGATGVQDKFLDATYARYMVIVKVSRVAFKGQTNVLTSLGVVGERPRSLSGWLRSAKILYSNLSEMPDALQVLAGFGYTAERLQEELSEKSAAQQSTQQRDEALDELCNRFSDFRAIARIALYDDPQLLEALGIT
ncbi:MAG: hypothetical protein LBF89_12410 [Bacteroidales bacterium]|jgi:hypothetical protein|nr:hypothetical protein [Bacteroidales bacterium]